MGKISDHKLEKQIGCMAGFLHIFDRHHLFAGKRISSAKRLTGTENAAPKTTPPPLPVLESKEATTTKFSKEAPRLSLDSRAVVDARGSFHPREVEVEKQRRSTSVVARLMGLDDSDPELRRSNSETRVPREDLNLPKQQYRFFDTTNFQLKQLHHNVDKRVSDPSVKGMRQKKNFCDSGDFFPGPKQSVSVVHGEIERRLKMRGIDEPSKDLDSLKQILEALQLKGLLHSKNSKLQLNHRNFVHDGAFSVNNSRIVVMKPGRRSPGSLHRFSRTGNDSPPSSASRSSPRARPEPGRNVRGINQSSPTHSPNRMRKGTNAETQRKVNDNVDRKRGSPVHSPRLNGPDRQVNSRSPRIRKANNYQKEEMTRPVVAPTAEDESSTVSDSSFSTSSYTDTERLLKVEDPYREGKNLLRRCDKLLNSIAELQPSPVSVLESSSVYRDDESPSPVMKRCIDYRDQAAEEFEDDAWSAALCCSEAKSDDCDFIYVSEILRASNCLPQDIDVFLFLEKQQSFRGNETTSKASTLQRRLIFDTVKEILNRNWRLPPWRAENEPLLRQIWLEFLRIREREDSSEDMFEVICGLLRKDMAAEGSTVNEWGECPVEMGDMVLDIERFVFKDLIGETIQHLASFKGKCSKVSALCRKLVF